MLIPFPIAFLVGACLSDIGYWSSGDPFWARAAISLAGAGLVTDLVAAVFGLVDFLFIRRVRDYRDAWLHLALNVIILLFTLWNVAHRLGGSRSADAAARAARPRVSPHRRSRSTSAFSQTRNA